MVILSLNSIAFSQTSLNDSLTCFNKTELTKIAKTISKVTYQDSIIQNQQLQIINYKSIDANLNQQIKLKTEIITKTEKQLIISNKKLKVAGVLIKFGLPGAFLGGFIIGKL